MTDVSKFAIKIEFKINDKAHFFMDMYSHSMENDVMDIGIYNADITLESGENHRTTGQKIANELKRINVGTTNFNRDIDESNVLNDNAAFVNNAIKESIWAMEMDGADASDFPHVVIDNKTATIIITKIDIATGK